MGKILIVDDDPNVQRLLQYTLKQEGYDVVIAADGAEGFRLWSTESPDLILLDVMLPKLDGYQVAAKIRAEDDRARRRVREAFGFYNRLAWWNGVPPSRPDQSR